jgi:protein-S-isoprenylcysteine O-methyltransferase Ste14
MNPLAAKAIADVGQKLLTVSVLLFLPAWSWHFREAWAFLPVFFIPQFLTALYLLKRDPGLLQRRIKGGFINESRACQKVFMLAVELSMASLFLVAGLDYRFNWSHVPTWLVMGADAVVLIGFLIQFCAFKENTFASVVVEVVPKQKVISTGPYAIVRHPMYAGAALVNLFAPLALGSWWGLPLALAWLTAILLRLLDEEEILRQQLPGYEEYCQKVQYRLIPYVS